MIADPTHIISKAYNVLREDEGVSDRATFIIDPDQIIKSIEITDEPIGRNAEEMFRNVPRLLRNFVSKNGDLTGKMLIC